MFPIHIKEQDSDLPKDPIYYLVTGSGIFLVKNHPLFHSKTRVEEIPWLPAEEAGFSFRGPKIPKATLAQVLAFFMAVWERYRTESIVVLYLKPEDRMYEVVVPRQLVGGIHCVYEEDLREDSNEIRVGTIHSHGHEDAFHSDRDNADESFQDGLHLIFGNLDTVPTLLCSAMVDGVRFPLSPGDILEGLPVQKELGPWRSWAQKEIDEHVKPLKKPIYFGT